MAARQSWGSASDLNLKSFQIRLEQKCIKDCKKQLASPCNSELKQKK
jgi:hypothetical protein